MTAKTATRSFPSTLSEIKTLLALGMPIMVAQLAQTGMGFVDTLMAGRVGAQDLAAVALGTSIWLPLFLTTIGILMATTPMVAHDLGANRLQRTRTTLQQGGWIALLLGVFAFIFLRNIGWIMQAMNVETALADKTQEYLKAISWGFPAMLAYQLIRSFSEGFGKTRPVMLIAVLGLLCNIPLNYIFIFGKLGLPAMGGVGCGWATAIVMVIHLLAGLFYIRRSPVFTPCKVFHRWQKPNIKRLMRFLKLGTPIGIALLIEASMFSIIALLLANQGAVIVSAHQMTMTFTGLIFMIPFSLSLAITIRTGHILGSGDPHFARRSVLIGTLMSLSFSVVSCTFIILLREQIAGLYTNDWRLITLAAELFVIAAFFQLPDVLQVAAAGALRGYKDTSVPLGLVFIAYWVIGLPAGYVLGLTDWIVPAMGPHGFWYGLLIGLSFGAILLLTRLRWMTHASIVNAA